MIVAQRKQIPLCSLNLPRERAEGSWVLKFLWTRPRNRSKHFNFFSMICYVKVGSES